MSTPKYSYNQGALELDSGALELDSGALELDNCSLWPTRQPENGHVGKVRPYHDQMRTFGPKSPVSTP